MNDDSLDPMDARLRDAVSALPETIEPSRDLWAGVRAGIDAARIQDLGKPALVPRRTVSVRVAVAAAAALVVMTAGTMWMALARAPEGAGKVAEMPSPTLTFAAYERSAAELTSLYERKASALDPATREVLERSIRTIDHALEEARAALERNPSDMNTQAFVESAYRQKLDFLRRANDVAMLREM